MATTQTVLQGKDTASQGELYMSLDLGDRSWKVTIGDAVAVRAGIASTLATPLRFLIAWPRRARALDTARSSRCIRATRPAVTAGGCIDG